MQKRFYHPFTLIPVSPREELVMKREPTPRIDSQYHAEFQYWMNSHIVTIRYCPLVNTPVRLYAYYDTMQYRNAGATRRVKGVYTVHVHVAYPRPVYRPACMHCK